MACPVNSYADFAAVDVCLIVAESEDDASLWRPHATSPKHNTINYALCFDYRQVQQISTSKFFIVSAGDCLSQSSYISWWWGRSLQN